jgi:hypothetical protein
MSDENRIMLHSCVISRYDRQQLRKAGISPIKVDELHHVKMLGTPDQWTDVFALALDVLTDTSVSFPRDSFDVRMRKYLRKNVMPAVPVEGQEKQK